MGRHPRSRRPQVGRRRSQRGVTLVEFALVAPIIFVLALGLLTVSLIVTNQIQLTNVVRDGARAAGICGGVARNARTPVPTLPNGKSSCSTAALKAWIDGRLTAVPGGVTPVVTVSANDVLSDDLDACDYGGSVDVAITYRQPLYVPFMDALAGDGRGTGTRTLHAEAQATCEQ